MPSRIAAQKPAGPAVIRDGMKGVRLIPPGWPALTQRMVADRASTTTISISSSRIVVLIETSAPRRQIAATMADSTNRPITSEAMPGIGACSQSIRSRKKRPNISGTVIAAMVK